MRDEEMLQKLLRLKRYETPGDDYFERFLDEFHARMARESRARHGVKDRFYAWLEELFPSPRLGWSAAAGGMMAVVAFAFLVSNKAPLGNQGHFVDNQHQGLPSSMEFASLPPIPSAPPVASTSEPVTPTPIMFPELMAPVSYSPSRAADGASSDSVNLTTTGEIVRRANWDNILRLRDSGAGSPSVANAPANMNTPETVLILDQDDNSTER